ncbi:MAG TPA: hypothetical protein VH478_16225 [Trebonia sp.]|nr:hypothetical protein [Trebonia sp.]
MVSADITAQDSRPAEGAREQGWTGRGWLILISLVIGVIIAVLWSADLVDDDIGVNAANGILGHDSLTTNITGSLAGIAFAFVTGLAGTFTACNVAAFSAIAPLMEEAPSAMTRAKAALRPLLWLSIGLIVVAAVYGAIAATLGTSIPQLSNTVVDGIMPARFLQAVIAFGLIGLIFVYLGLATAGIVPDPMRRATERFRYAPQLLMGALIGGFLIGRPYPLFYKTFEYAASTHDGAYGALVFVLVSLGNIVLMGVLFLLLSMTRFPQWLTASPSRAAKFTAVALLIGGAFTIAYWVVRLPANFGIGWFPHMPWS